MDKLKHKMTKDSYTRLATHYSILWIFVSSSRSTLVGSFLLFSNTTTTYRRACAKRTTIFNLFGQKPIWFYKARYNLKQKTVFNYEFFIKNTSHLYISSKLKNVFQNHYQTFYVIF